MKKTLLTLSIISLLTISCSTDSVPIVYGEDQCAHCMMTIVQQQYGTEIISKKGKVFKFDAIECLIDYVDKGGIAETEISDEYVTAYTLPEILTPANECYFLHSPMLPSPMGMFLTALQSKDEAEQFRLEYGGNIYSWKDLKNNFNNLPTLRFH